MNSKELIAYFQQKEASFINDKKVFELSQNDFLNGSLTVTESGLYKLKEDIVLDFNKTGDYRATDQYNESLAFSLDYFAGLIFNGSDFILDLNQKTIKMSDSFALQQRFFSVIELATAPFLPGQGPGNFGPIESSQLVFVKNGTVGRSSHHCIKGNKCSKICMQNVVLKDWEVAGVALNGGVIFKFDKVQSGPNCQNVPVSGSYSAARFLPKFYKRLQAGCTAQEWKHAEQKFLALDKIMKRVYDEVISTGKTTYPIFKNDQMVPDGNGYGFLVHPAGIAVHDYKNKDFDQPCEDVEFEDCTTPNIKVAVKEVVGISAFPNGSGIQLDPSGSVFSILSVLNTDGTYKPNVLSEAQLTFAELANKYKLSFGKLSISDDLIRWARSGENINQSLLSKGYTFKCNGDVMYHLCKPVHGFRLDGINNLKMKRCVAEKVVNVGLMGDDQSCGSYKYSHDQQERPGYHGAETIGFNFSRVQNAEIKDCSVKSNHSDNGSNYGFRFINGCKKVKLSRTRGGFLTCGVEYVNGHWYGKNSQGETASFVADDPNGIPSAVGIKIEDVDCEVTFDDVQFGNNFEAPGCCVPIWSNAD